MADPVQTIKDETRSILHDQHDAWRGVVRGLDADALNWTPGDGANSITVLVSHSCDAERFLMASSVDVELDRDRDEHFRSVASGPQELLDLIDQTEREVDGYIDRLTADNLSAEIVRPSRTHTGAWWVLHAVEHSREHLGQALLTRQMYEQQG